MFFVMGLVFSILGNVFETGVSGFFALKPGFSPGFPIHIWTYLLLTTNEAKGNFIYHM